MNRRHWLYTIAATIAAAFLPKSREDRFTNEVIEDTWKQWYYVPYGNGKYLKVTGDQCYWREVRQRELSKWAPEWTVEEVSVARAEAVKSGWLYSS